MPKILSYSFHSLLIIIIGIIHYYGTKPTFYFSGPPPPINISTYFLLGFILPLTNFSIFSFSPSKSKLRKVILVSSMLSMFLFPLIFSNIYTSAFHIPIALSSFIYSSKMLIWLKNSSRYPDSTNPFIWSLFHWRPKEGKIPDDKQKDLLKQRVTNEKLESCINYHYKRAFCAWILYVSCAQFVELFPPIIPDTPYPIRIVNYFYDGTPFISFYGLFYCYIYAGALFFSMNYLYEIIIISSAHLLFYIYSTPNSLLHTKLTKYQLNSLKLWLISFLFYTKSIFNHPYRSQDPRDLWSIRWHLIFNEIFIELGYKPARHLFSFTSAKLQKIFGTLAAFAISGILHEYILYSSNRYLTFEQLTYFLFNAIMMIIWEFFTNSTKTVQDQKPWWKNIRNSLFMNVVIILSIPWFIEPYIRCEQYHSMMHFICRKFSN